MRAHGMTLEIVANHVLARDGDGVRALIDTGSPGSFGDRPFKIGGLTSPVLPGTCSMAVLSAKVGTPIDALLGMDLLGPTPLELPFVARGSQPRATVAVRSIHGLPCVTAHIAGLQVNAIVDTGATVCFVDELPVFTPDVVTPHHDFLGMDGCSDFVVNKQTLPVEVGGQRVEADVAQAPDKVRVLMQRDGFQALIGMSFLRRFHVTLDMTDHTLTLE